MMYNIIQKEVKRIIHLWSITTSIQYAILIVTITNSIN